MCNRGVLFFIALFCTVVPYATAQSFSIPTGSSVGTIVDLDAIQNTRMDMNLFMIDSQSDSTTPLQSRTGSISKLDLKAPGKARREYEKGYQLLMRKDLQGAVAHLSNSIAIYSSYVAAHNALGTAYLDLGQNDQARDAFSKAAALDDHLPSSFLNLGCAQLALSQYSEAEESFRKASSIAPLDLELLTALAYGEFVNHDYPAVLATAHEVHSRKHKNAAVVHFFAAGALEAQHNLPEAQNEMETLLKEDPKSPSAGQFRDILEQIKLEQKLPPPEAKLQLVQTVALSIGTDPTPEEASRSAQRVLQDLKERRQIAEAEAEPEATCLECGRTVATNAGVRLEQPRLDLPHTTFRAAVEEVGIIFSATDHGKPVTNLTPSDVTVSDDNRPPAAVLAFRNESELPLRLGLIIDTSDSVASRLAFEQAAAVKFLQALVTGKDDLAFVIGVNNSVLLVQDFSADQTLTARAVNQLAPGGGTALWDAVAFAADKLARRREEQPVARVLVVLSDGDDNSSSTTLKQVIASALQGEIAVYTVSTRDLTDQAPDSPTGDHALKTLSELTGGAAFVPGSIRGLKGSLSDVQQVIRSRYLVSYKPAAFQRDGHYRPIEIQAQKDGRQLRVYARKGYYAAAAQPAAVDR
jgi:Ca-activated chloride channel homolog